MFERNRRTLIIWRARINFEPGGLAVEKEEDEKKAVVSRVRLTVEDQWKYSTEFWIEIFLGFCRTLAEEMGLGWDKVNEGLLKGSDGWPGVLKTVDMLKLSHTDSRVWASTEAFAGVNAWPGYIDEITEYSPNRTAIKGHGPSTGGRCVILDIAMRLGLDRKMDLASWCARNADAYLRNINPKLRFVQTKAMCRGDTHDYGYAEQTNFDIQGSQHSCEQLRPFDEFKRSKLKPYGE